MEHYQFFAKLIGLCLFTCYFKYEKNIFITNSDFKLFFWPSNG